MILSPRHQDHDTARPEVTWEEADCPLCAHRAWTPLVEARDPLPPGGGLWFAVVRCVRCGTCFTNPRPDAASIRHFYPTDYLPFRRPRNRAPRHWYPWAMLQGRCVERRELPPVREGGRLLDFGCGGGSFLERMAKQGWEVTGLDASAEAVKRVREGLGLHALQGTLPHPELAPASFDVITMWHSLEHVHDPLGALRAAHDLLRPGGRLFVAVPNIGGWPFRWFGRSWFALDLPRHLTHFTASTLRAMLGRAGFQVEPIRMIRHGDWLRSSARLACLQGRPSPLARLLTLKPIARLAAWACYALRRSDCMMAVARRPD
jgi:2-polyprenyl-3-methyl-5-hydroxy-6-metoxy-1,4-benzoquinol methylase